MRTLREAMIDRINSNLLGKEFTIADFDGIPESREYQFPNIAMAQVLCALADRRGVLRRTGAVKRLTKTSKALMVFTTIGTTPIPVKAKAEKKVDTVGDRLQGMLNYWMYKETRL